VDPKLLEVVLPEIRSELSGRRATGVRLAGKWGVLIRFAGAPRDLWLSAHPQLSRIGLVDAAPVGAEPRDSPDNLGEPLAGATLRGVEQEPGGRLVRLRFERDSARHREPLLVAELIPRFANLILVGDASRILWACREFRGEGRPRQVAAGEAYVAPAGAPPSGAPPEGARLRTAAEIGAWYREQEEADAASELLAELRRVLTRRRRRAAKALEGIDARLNEADREPELRRHAELLAANLARVRRGVASVMLPDFDGAREVIIALDPKLDPQANVESLFKKARRAARGRDELVAQRSIQEQEIADADRGLAASDPPPPPAELRALVARVAPSLLAGARGGGAGATDSEAAPRAPSLPDGFVPRRYVLPGGWEVWVGKSAKQNDELTHRWASPRDLWFHARGAQGSHTVLRIASGKGEPPREIIAAAAAIAAWHSKARNSKLVPVAYTEKRYVRRPRKSPVGTAMMMREKVLMVEPGVPEQAGAE
jgi:predicted ribosome quality control (RQC) complex YloA/Tae2 family protein